MGCTSRRSPRQGGREVTRKLIVVDVETTGLDPFCHQILELAAIDVESGAEFYMAPSVSTSALGAADVEALAINRYYERRVPSGMLSHEETLSSYDRLRDMLRGNTFAGSNPRFDAAFIAKRTSEVWHHRLADLSSYSGAALRLAPHELVGLDQVCAALGVKNEEPHSALGDARATAECFRQLAAHYGAVPGTQSQL
jgi:DNA polymerase-3 subunit epsilon